MKKFIFTIFLFFFFAVSVVYASVESNYLNEIPIKGIWQHPYRISVYIANVEKRDILKKAFKLWDDKLGTAVNFVYLRDPAGADIYATFVGGLNRNMAGITYNTYTKDNKKYLSRTKMAVSRVTPFGLPYSDEDLFSVCLHEIGHALGIGGHSKSKDDIMYPDTSGSLQGKGMISNRDINTVLKIYGR
jgi:hypothetical protein